MREHTNLFKKVREQIEYRQQRLREGKVNAIPYNFERLSSVIPGIMPELMVGSTSISGGGKSLIDQELHIHNPFNYWRKYRDTKDIDIKIFYYPLEDSVEMTMKRFMIKEIFNRHGQTIGMFDIEGVLGNRILSDETNRRIDALEPYFEEFYSKVTLLDKTNPTAIFKSVEDWLLKPENGCIVDEYGNKLNPEEIKEAHNPKSEKFRPTSYRPTNPNRIVIVSVDNLQNITTEEGCSTAWDACDRLCRVYLRKKLCNYYKCFISMVTQQSKDKEKAVYKMDGTSVSEKFVPSLDSIGIYKNIDASCHFFYAIFDPSRYKINQWESGNSYYDIDRLDCYYRQFSVLKSNFCQVGTAVSFFFNGVNGQVVELPRAEDREKMEQWYTLAERLQAERGGYKPLKMSA